jgi:hypothetical protein
VKLFKSEGPVGEHHRIPVSVGDSDPLMAFAAEGQPEEEPAPAPAPPADPQVPAAAEPAEVAPLEVALATAVSPPLVEAPAPAAPPAVEAPAWTPPPAVARREPLPARARLDAMHPAGRTATPTARRLASRRFGSRQWYIGAGVAAAVIGVAVAGAIGYLRWSAVDAAEPRPSHVTLETNPPGAQVMVDGQTRGESPLTVSLVAGSHLAILRHAGEEKTIALTVRAGADLVEHVEFNQPAAPPVPDTGALSVTTDPPGARIQIDGKARGTSPLTVSDLLPADHKIAVSNGDATVERTVRITAGGTASMMISMAKAPVGPAAGWVAMAAPFDVDVLEGDTIVGGGRNPKIMLPAGHHTLSLGNTVLGYRETRTVDVAAGATATVRVAPPNVTVNVNARPWADVVVAGRDVGQTPIANLALPVGTYEFTFRHPQLGERKATMNVTANGPNRLSVDLTKP